MESSLAPSAVLPVLAELARAAGREVMALRSPSLEVLSKEPGEIVTSADLVSQELILSGLSHSFPGVPVYAEEGRGHRSEARTRFVVDPLDGTTPWVWGNSGFAVSIAFERDGVVVAGVVHDPVFDECFTALLSAGAWRNGLPIRVARPVPISESLVVCDWGNADGVREPGVDAYRRLLVPEMRVRRAVPQFAPALGLARVAEGRIHALVCNDTWVEDHAAGALLVSEAGGSVSGYGGTPFDHRSPGILAACTPALAAELRAALGTA